MMEKLTKISGGIVIGLSILISFLSFMKGISPQITTSLSLCLLFVIAVFISSANRKEGEGQVFCWITLISSVFMIIFTLVNMITFKSSSVITYGITSSSLLLFSIGMVVTLLSTFLAVVSNTLSNDGTVESLKKVVVGLTIIFIIYFILCMFVPRLASVPFTYLVSIGCSVILIATLFVFVLDKIHTFEEITDLTSNYREQAGIIQKLKENEEQINKEKEELLQKISKLEKACSGVPKRSYPQQVPVNDFSQPQQVSPQQQQFSPQPQQVSAIPMTVKTPSTSAFVTDGSTSLISSSSANTTPVEQATISSEPTPPKVATNPIPQLKL